jgi:hypothetical protein
MISSLRDYDNITALGILARAALSLEDKYNPAAIDKLSDELQIRESLIKEIRKKLGISPRDSSSTALDRLADALDFESNSLIEETNDSATFERLADKGELPSDLFEINIIGNIKDFLGKKYDVERKFIEDTIRLPDSEQHYGPPVDQNDPFLISLFSKRFPNKNPKNSFTMLVAGERSNGVELSVHQAWRIYKDKSYFEGVVDLVDMLRRFADEFGAEIEVGGKEGHFFLTADIPNNNSLQYKIKLDNKWHGSKKRNEITVTHFIQNGQCGTKRAALIVAIDLMKYRKMLKLHGW